MQFNRPPEGGSTHADFPSTHTQTSWRLVATGAAARAAPAETAGDDGRSRPAPLV